MVEVTANMAMSLDGYIAGPNNSRANPLGDGGHRLHEWLTKLAGWRERQGMEGGDTNASNDLVVESFANTGAVIMGRRMFNEGEEPWGDNPPFRVPVFVLSHKEREPLSREGGTSFTFVTGGIHDALAKAKAVAGDKNVDIAGGADTVQQFITADLLDAIDIHLVPITLGSGTRLFEGLSDDIRFDIAAVVPGDGVTHLRYRARR